MIQISLKELETGTGGNLVHRDGDVSFSGVSIDTRSLQPGNLFFAIRGAKQDGHRFIPDALKKGALGGVVEKGYAYPGEIPKGRVLLEVADTHQALKDLANLVRRRWPGTLVAITGSMGKTTTKEFVASLMQCSFKVYRSPGNYNNLYGLPLAIFGLSQEDDFGIFEMGMSAPGEIAAMCRAAEPDVGIITNVAPVHLAFFNSLEDIARAKGELAQALPPEGTLIYNSDDPLVRAIADEYLGHKFSFGISSPADIRADQIEIVSLNETRFRISWAGDSRPATLPFAGAHYVMNALPALVLGLRHGIALEYMIEALGSLKQASMRGQISRFRKGFTLVDDSYNSNPRALMQMIQVLAQTPSFARRILVAGEMLELGPGSEALHFECGAFAAAQKVDLVFGIQGAAQEIVRGAVHAGIPATKTGFFVDAGSAASSVEREIREGDLVLVKGSRGVHLEKIVQSLRSHFEIAD
jgi:UDP-N-acetylmuramoyl-tripeptide--D-alanyl-D-alanine ligase